MRSLGRNPAIRPGPPATSMTATGSLVETHREDGGIALRSWSHVRDCAASQSGCGTVMTNHSPRLVLPRSPFLDRRTIGAFGFEIPASTKAAMLPDEERTLSILRHIQQTVPFETKWWPEFKRYVDILTGRVAGMGGDPRVAPTNRATTTCARVRSPARSSR